MRILSAILLGSFALLAVSKSAHAAESYANCNGVIASVPKTISTPGVWCVKQNLATASTSAKAINIASDNVTLDCNDFTLAGAGGTGDTSIGIFTNSHINITVRHCNVQGFRYGLSFLSAGGGGGHVIEDNSFNANTSTGIRVDGDGSVIRRNRVFNTGGSTTVNNATGIYGTNSVTISDNTVSGVTARAASNGNAYGIYTSNNPNGSIEDNRVRGLAKDGTGKIYGIYNAKSVRVTARNNALFGDGSTGSIALTCANSSGRAKDNIINGFVVGLSKCGDAGENDISP
jgi:hypothetical protein